MNKIYYRVMYCDIGIYEALKREIWNKSNFPKREWDKIKNTDAFTWLRIPNYYTRDNYSYFTELGYKLFTKNTYPLIIKYLDEKNIRIEKFNFNDMKLNIVYKDEHQIVIEK